MTQCNVRLAVIQRVIIDRQLKETVGGLSPQVHSILKLFAEQRVAALGRATGVEQGPGQLGKLMGDGDGGPGLWGALSGCVCVGVPGLPQAGGQAKQNLESQVADLVKDTVCADI